jgi:hypothetical protein
LIQFRADVPAQHAQALIQVRNIVPKYVMTPMSLQSLCQHCTSLRELVLTAKFSSLDCRDCQDAPWVEYRYGTGPGIVTGREAASAIQSLTCLHQLTCLKFTPADDIAHTALVRACCVLEGHSLQELHITQGFEGGVTAAALMQLGQLRQLRKLSVNVVCEKARIGLEEGGIAFLSAVSNIKLVEIIFPFAPECFECCADVLKQFGMPVPSLELYAYD